MEKAERVQLGRATLKSRRRLDSLTGMRACAAGAVVLHHTVVAWQQLPTFAAAEEYGYVGISFFFCLSGFVMAWTWSNGGYDRFYAKRFARIWPLAMFGLLASLTAYWVIHDPLAGNIGPPRSVVYSALLLQSWFNDPHIVQSWDGVSWTLSCEAFFYLLSPLILPLFLKLRARFCIVLIVAIYGVDAIVQFVGTPHAGVNGPSFFLYNPLTELPVYMLGVLACRLILLGRRLPVRTIVGTFFATVVAPLWIFCLIVPSAHRYGGEVDLVALPGFFLIIMIGAGRDVDNRQSFLARKSMVWLGDSSYALYVTHALLLGLFLWWLAKVHIVPICGLEGEAFVVVFVIMAVVFAGVCHHAIERPMQRHLLRLLPGRRRPSRIGLGDP
jgi:peptidoglycan/LPS O-acetylase OafA/YrhL